MNWHDYFTYDAETGNLIWKIRSDTTPQWNGRYSGKIAGHSQGVGAGTAVYVRVHNKMYRAHRIVWEMRHGPIPSGMLVDHVDGDYENNRLPNLRMANSRQNGNNRTEQKNNSTGLKGVSYDRGRGKYVAQIRANGKTTQLGRYTTKSMAAVVYAKASIRLHGVFSPFMRKVICRSAANSLN